MSYYGTIKVVDGTGWSKTFSLEKAITLIGSAAFNDVVLSEQRGSGVAAVHFQLIRTQVGTHGFRLVNLVSETFLMILARARGEDVIQPKGTRDLEDGDAVQVGDFTITFYLRTGNGVSIEKRSENIGIRFEMPGVKLRPGVRLAGLLTVMNYGEERRSQFEIELEGLPSDCFQIDPAPLLYPGGEEKLQVRFFHRGIRPLAGECPICLRASAVGAYPTEELMLPLVLDVEPVYHYEVGWMKDQSPPEEELEPALPLPAPNTTVLEPVSLATKSTSPGEESPQPAAMAVEEADAPSAPPIAMGEPLSMVQPPARQVIDNSKVVKQDDWEKAIPPRPEKPEVIPSKLQPAPVQPVVEESEADWWSEDREKFPAVASSDPLADLKRGITPRLSVEKANIQVLKAAPEDLQEKIDESKADIAG